jgi:hypothetical protein
MGLLARTNPHATRASVIGQALAWGAIGAVLCLTALYWKPSLRPFWPLLVPVSMVLGAALGGLMEWQLDDGPDTLEGAEGSKTRDASSESTDPKTPREEGSFD